MILLVGVLLGLVVGLLRARVGKRTYALPQIERMELALLAFFPQAITFFVPQSSQVMPPQWSALILPISLGILVLFVWFNRKVAGFGLLGLGLLLNFAVIATNGGLMPISPETLAVVHGARAEEFADGRTYGAKSIVLAAEETRLEWLADRFTVPDELPIQFAYSLGDVFLAIGAFWTLWVGGAPRKQAANALIDEHFYSSHSQRRV